MITAHLIIQFQMQSIFENYTHTLTWERQQLCLICVVRAITIISHPSYVRKLILRVALCIRPTRSLLSPAAHEGQLLLMPEI